MIVLNKHIVIRTSGLPFLNCFLIFCIIVSQISLNIFDNAAVSNRGNVVGTVKDSYNSKAFGKALKAGAQAGAISGITAGVTQATGLGSMTEQVGGVEVAKSGVGRYVALGQRGLVQGAATSVVTGEKLNKSLEQSMGSAALAMGQTAVGDIAASSGMADGSVTKVAMHAAVGGVYSVANGGKFATGALGGAAGEVLGSNIDANDKAGGAKVQFATTVGGFLAGANAKDMQMAANVAASSFEHNRRMHPKELQYLNELKAGKSEEERREYDAAAFALIKADKGVPASDRYSSYIKSQVREGSRYEAKQQELKAYAQSKGDYDAFEYGWMDRMSDFAARNVEIGVRARGGIKVGVGASGAIVSAGVGSATAPAGGAFLGAAGATASTMYAVSGYQEAFGAYNSTEGADVLRSAQTPTNSFAYDAHTNIGLAASEAVLSGIAAQKLGGVALDAASKGKALAKGGLQKAKDVLKQGAASPAPAAASHVTTATSPASKVTAKPAATTVASSSAATKPAANATAPTTPMASANGNNSPGVVTNNTTVKVNNTAVNQNSNTNVETYTNFAENIWTSPKGTKQTYKVYQRKDIDWDLVRTAGDKRFIGKTNKEAAQSGHRPQLEGGYFATTHHIGQNSKGPIVEASTEFHGFSNPQAFRALHSQHGKRKPHPEFPVDHDIWNTEQAEYWKWRAKNAK